jgi:hypothetical protein
MDQSVVHPLVSVPRNGRCIARLFVALVEGDLAEGLSRPPPPPSALRFRLEGRDWWSAPIETIARGWGDCSGIVRLVAGTRGDELGVVRTADGWHLFLRERGTVLDPCVDYGMERPPPETYDGAALEPIRRPGIVPPAPATAPRTEAAAVTEVVGLVAATAPDAATAKAVKGTAPEVLAALATASGSTAPEVHAAALAAFSRAARGSDQQRAVAAVAAVTAGDALATRALRARLSIAEDDDLPGKARLLAALAGLRARGIRLPLEEPPPQTPLVEFDGLEEDVSAIAARAGCPGSCASRRRQ